MFELLTELARYHVFIASGIALVMAIARRKSWPVLSRDRRFFLLFLFFEIFVFCYGTLEQMVLGIPGGPRSFWSALLQTWLCLYLWTASEPDFRNRILRPFRRWTKKKEN